MTAARITLIAWVVLASGGTAGQGAEIKLVNGTVLQGEIVKYKPAEVEIRTERGSMIVAFDQLPTEVQQQIPRVKGDTEKLVDGAAKLAEIAVKGKERETELRKSLADMIALNKELSTEVEKLRAQSAMRSGGIPPQIAASIKSAAAEKWPGDYEMQAYEIKNQTEAYRKIGGR